MKLCDQSFNEAIHFCWSNKMNCNFTEKSQINNFQQYIPSIIDIGQFFEKCVKAAEQQYFKDLINSKNRVTTGRSVFSTEMVPLYKEKIYQIKSNQNVTMVRKILPWFGKSLDYHQSR